MTDPTLTRCADPEEVARRVADVLAAYAEISAG